MERGPRRPGTWAGSWRRGGAQEGPSRSSAASGSLWNLRVGHQCRNSSKISGWLVLRLWLEQRLVGGDARRAQNPHSPIPGLGSASLLLRRGPDPHTLPRRCRLSRSARVTFLVLDVLRPVRSLCPPPRGSSSLGLALIPYLPGLVRLSPTVTNFVPHGKESSLSSLCSPR